MSNSPFGAPRDNDNGTGLDDDMIVIDGLDEVDESPFWVPPGIYQASVSDVEKATSKAGNPMLKITFTLEKAIDAERNEHAIGKDLRCFLSFAPKAKWKLVATLRGLGLDVSGKQLKFSTRSLMGKKARIEVEDSDYGDSKSSSVKSVEPLK